MKEVEWFVAVLSQPDIDSYGGYYNPSFRHGDRLYVAETFRENGGKYACIECYSVKSIVSVYNEIANKEWGYYGWDLFIDKDFYFESPESFGIVTYKEELDD